MDTHDKEPMYFTNLLSQDQQYSPSYDGQSENSPLSLNNSPSLEPNNLTIVKKSIRGANFTTKEDDLLVAAWLNCGMDAVKATDQRHSQYWERIFEFFQENRVSTVERTVKSLIQRWALIQKTTNKFCGILAQVEGLPQSGTTKDDRFEKAKIMYSSLEKSNFQFEHCWRLLKDKPKWISHITKDGAKKRKTMSTSSRDDVVVNVETRNVLDKEVIELERPVGRKAEKEKRKAKAKQVEENFQFRKLRYTLLEESRAQEKEFYLLKVKKIEFDKEVQEKRLRQDDERLRLDAQKSDQGVMLMDLSVMSEMQRSYFQDLQKEIMTRRGLA